MSDPTYNINIIKKNADWYLAWRLSEVDNDNAPIGWWKYINISKWLIDNFEMKEINVKSHS